MTLEFNDFFVAAFARVMAQRLRGCPYYLVTASLSPMTDAYRPSAPQVHLAFTACRAVMDDFGTLVQVTPWV